MSTKEIPKPDFMDDEAWEMLMKTRDPAIIKIGARAHVQRYLETNGGEDTFTTQGGPTLLLGTTGRKSGNEQITPANFLQEGDVVYVVGSIAGLDRHPSWVLNLEANPEAWVQVKDRRWNVTARKVEGDEKKEVWPRLVDFFPLWGHFQKYCEREFSTFVLTPRED
jgi:deazaflavin-dependent oxidoreductase (nitroreductase family)